METPKHRRQTAFSLLIKPASADCNLACEYCFYLDKHRLYPETRRHRMTDQVLEKLISSYLATSQPVYHFGWQGGEPTLMGVAFFQRVVELQKKYGNWGAVVSNGLQTNATLIDDDMAALFSAYKFLIGVSIDGPPEIHDRYRTGVHGRGSHADVLRGIDCLNKHQVEFNALVLVNAANVNNPREIYHYIRDMGIYHHQYIPCVEFDPSGNPQPYSITGKQWGEFLCSLFDEWKKKDTRRVSIRHFDAIVRHMVQWQYSVCHMAGDCRQYFLVEHNGDVYPCDFFVESRKKLGNVTEDSWEGLNASSAYRSFGRQKSNWNSRCTHCRYLRYCAGDCLKNRFMENDDSQTVSWLCEGWKTFYNNCLPALEQLAVTVLNEQQSTLPPGQRQHVGRLPATGKKPNDPCYCGSGRKYKDCHGVGRKRKKKG